MKTDKIRLTLGKVDHLYADIYREAMAELAALEADNAAKDAAISDGILWLENAFESMSPKDLMAIIYKAEKSMEAALTPDSGKTTPAINSATGSGVITEINLWRDGPKKYRTPKITIEEGDLINWDDTGFEIVRDGVTVRRVELSECELVSPEPDSGKVCEWSTDPSDDFDDTWQTECGHEFVINDGKPSENDMQFCCFCGRKLDERIEVKSEDDDDEED